jgi:hypothetical protein
MFQVLVVRGGALLFDACKSRVGQGKTESKREREGKIGLEGLAKLAE